MSRKLTVGMAAVAAIGFSLAMSSSANAFHGGSNGSHGGSFGSHGGSFGGLFHRHHGSHGGSGSECGSENSCGCEGNASSEASDAKGDDDNNHKEHASAGDVRTMEAPSRDHHSRNNNRDGNHRNNKKSDNAENNRSNDVKKDTTAKADGDKSKEDGKDIRTASDKEKKNDTK